jgi:arylsulfatase A-like enzyme
MVFVGRDFVWQAPIAYALLFLGPGLLLALVALAKPRWVSPQTVAFIFATLGAFALLLPFPEVSRLAALILSAGVAAAAARAVRQRSSSSWRRLGRITAALAALTALVAVGAPLGWRVLERRWVAALPEPREAAPNVLLIILDTVRAASLSLYGNEARTTPALERWARDGAVFDWAIAPSSWTLPSHASMFTGYAASDLTANWTRPLDGAHPTLAEVFADHGYRTMAISANLDYGTWDSGLGRGFQHFRAHRRTLQQLLRATSYTQTALYEELIEARSLGEAWRAVSSPDLSIDPKHSADPRRADLVTGPFLEWHAENRDRPFFAFLNYFDGHQGYYSPTGFPKVVSGNRGIHSYQNAIAWLDYNVDLILKTLAERDVLDNTIVIVTSDHGELFSEHGLSGHAHNLYLNTLRVPLFIRYPPRVTNGARVGREVSLRDLGATILDLAGISREFPGHSLAASIADTSATLSEVRAEVRKAPNIDRKLPTARGDLVSLFDPTLQFIRNADGGEELFRYREAVAQRLDSSAAIPQAAERLRLRARSILADSSR